VHLAESGYVLQFARTKVPAGFDSKISNFAIPQELHKYFISPGEDVGNEQY